MNRPYLRRLISTTFLLFTHTVLAADDSSVDTADEVVVTATRFAEPYIDQPANITVITAAQIEESGVTTVPELLSLQAGINVRDFFGNGAALSAVDLRGFGAGAAQNTLILVDGRQLNDIDLSGVQWPAIPLSAIERIEIVRGSGAVQYGNGATAGVINIVTRKPEAGARSASVSTRAGNLDTQEVQATASLASARAGITGGGSYYHSDGYRSNNRNDTSTAFADMRWMGERSVVSLKVGADHQSLRLPGARLVQPSAGIDLLATDRRGTATPLDFAKRTGARASLEWERQLERVDFNLGLGYRDKDQRSYFDFGGFPDYREVDLGVWAFTPRMRVPFGLLGGQATVVAGLDWYRWDYGLRLSNSESNIGQPINRVSADQDNTALYAQFTLDFSKGTSLRAGWRGERQKIDAHDTFDPAAPGGAFGSGAPPGSQTLREQAWELALRQQITGPWAALLRGGRSFRFATVDEIYETSPAFTREFQFLQAQTALGFDLGVEYRTGNLYARATAFQLDVDNEIHLDPFTTGVGNTNLPPSRRRGLELEGSWRLTDAVTLGASYTYMHARFREGVFPGSAFTQQNVDITGKTVPLVPTHHGNLMATWRPAQLWLVSASLEAVSSQFMENDEPNSLGEKIPAYTLANLQMTYSPGKWRFTAAIDNLLDEKYYNYAVRSQFVADRYNAYPLPERTFWVGAEYRFE